MNSVAKLAVPLLALSLLGCPGGDASTPSGDDGAAPGEAAAPAGGDAQALGELFAEVVTANGAGDLAAVAAVCRRVYPDAARIRAGLREDAPAETVAKIEAFYQGLRPADGDDAAWAKLLETTPAGSAPRTEVKVYSATTEEIAANARGSVVALEFKEAPSVAARLLRPGLTFHVVEVTGPGEELGTKFYLFFWHEAEWCMLGPVWRAER